MPPYRNRISELKEEVDVLCKQSHPLFDTCEAEKGDGRIETRRCEVCEKGFIVDEGKRWKNLATEIKITSTRELANKVQIQERFYISSLKADNDFNKYIRDHWSVENNLHWTLDMTFREDGQCKHAITPLKILRSSKIALNLLKKDKGKESLRSKRLKAAWNKEFLIKILKNYNAFDLSHNVHFFVIFSIFYNFAEKI